MTNLEKINHVLKNKRIDTIIVSGQLKFDGRLTFHAPQFTTKKINNGLFISKDDENFITIKESYLYDVYHQDQLLFIELK